MAQQLNRLVDLERVKDWVGATSNSDDLLLTRLIDGVSRFILSYLQRPTLFQNTFTDIYDGYGTNRQALRNWPVINVSSVTIGFNEVAPFQVPPIVTPYTLIGVGYVFDPWDGYPPGRTQFVSLRGYYFARGNSNVQIVYESGFVVQNESQTVPSGTNNVLAVNAPNGSWAVDQGVTYVTSGLPLTAVPYNPSTSLSVGQYMVSRGNYYFATADASAAVLISYSYVPADIEQVAMEMVAERYSYKNRVGLISKTLAGNETMSYSQKSMPDFLASILQPYRKVIPV